MYCVYLSPACIYFDLTQCTCGVVIYYLGVVLCGSGQFEYVCADACCVVCVGSVFVCVQVVKESMCPV